jgi:hypothetical protein
MALYKVSYVVPGQPAAGAILTRRDEPRVGEIVVLHGQRYQVAEIIELIPPQGVVHFLHVTLTPLAEEA